MKEVTIQAVESVTCRNCIFECSWDRISKLTSNDIDECPYMQEMVKLGLPDCDDGYVYKVSKNNIIDLDDLISEIDMIPCDNTCNEDHRCRACSAFEMANNLKNSLENKNETKKTN